MKHYEAVGQTYNVGDFDPNFEANPRALLIVMPTKKNLLVTELNNWLVDFDGFNSERFLLVNKYIWIFKLSFGWKNASCTRNELRHAFSLCNKVTTPPYIPDKLRLNVTRKMKLKPLASSSVTRRRSWYET